MSPPSPEPGRTCLGCRRPRDRRDLLRIVRGPSGEACFDLDARLPGRGGYVCPEPGCVAALTSGALAHALHAPVALPQPAARAAALAALLERRVGNLLTMARRTRGLVFGPAGVRAALAGGRASLLLLALDLPPSAASAWRALAGGVPVRAAATARALGMLAGREPFSVGAVCVPGLATALARAVDQWRAISSVSCDTRRSGNSAPPGGAR